MSNKTVSIHAVEAASFGLSCDGYSLDYLLEEIGVAVSFFNKKDLRLPIEHFERIVTNIIMTTQDEGLRLLPRPLRRGTFITAGRLAVHCSNLSQAIRRVIQFYNLVDSGAQFVIEERGNKTTLRLFTEKLADAKKSGIVLDMYAIGLHRFFSWLVGHRIVCTSTTLMENHAQFHQNYDDLFFDERVIFGADESSFTFSNDYLFLPIHKKEADLVDLARQKFCFLSDSLLTENSLSAKIRTLIAAQIEGGEDMPDLRHISVSIGLSARSIGWQLSREGVRFRDLVSLVRRDIAMKYMAMPSMSLEDIAFKTGYSELSAFSRAFKAWTEMSPKDYRRKSFGAGRPDRRIGLPHRTRSGAISFPIVKVTH